VLPSGLEVELGFADDSAARDAGCLAAAPSCTFVAVNGDSSGRRELQPSSPRRAAQPLRDRQPARVIPTNARCRGRRCASMISCAMRESVLGSIPRPAGQCCDREAARIGEFDSFPALWTGLKGRCGSHRNGPGVRSIPSCGGDPDLLLPYARLSSMFFDGAGKMRRWRRSRSSFPGLEYRLVMRSRKGLGTHERRNTAEALKTC